MAFCPSVPCVSVVVPPEYPQRVSMLLGGPQGARTERGRRSISVCPHARIARVLAASHSQSEGCGACAQSRGYSRPSGLLDPLGHRLGGHHAGVVGSRQRASGAGARAQCCVHERPGASPIRVTVVSSFPACAGERAGARREGWGTCALPTGGHGARIASHLLHLTTALTPLLQARAAVLRSVRKRWSQNPALSSADCPSCRRR